MEGLRREGDRRRREGSGGREIGEEGRGSGGRETGEEGRGSGGRETGEEGRGSEMEVLAFPAQRMRMGRGYM